MSDFSSMARDPEHRRQFEKLLYLAAQRGDADQVAERLGWGIDPNCCSPRGRTPLMANIRAGCPSVATVLALLKGGADPNAMDHAGLTALDYARRKLGLIQSRGAKPPRKSPSLDENDQLQLPAWEQKELDRFHQENPDLDPEFFKVYWQQRLRAARRTFNDPDQIERIVELLEAAAGPVA